MDKQAWSQGCNEKISQSIHAPAEEFELYARDNAVIASMIRLQSRVFDGESDPTAESIGTARSEGMQWRIDSN